MEIKFLQDYKKYKKGEIVRKPSILAKKYIDGGMAEHVEASFLIRNLYVATIIKAEERNIVHMEGPAKHIGIFTKEEYGYALIKPVYTHLRTKRKFITNGRLKYSDNAIMNSGLVVDDRSVQEFGQRFFDKMLKYGWTNNSRISIKDIIEIEDRLNGVTKVKNDEENIK